MIGLVIVSHSAKLAEGICEVAEQVGRGRVRLAAAGGTGDPEHPIGTDASRVLDAIDSVYSDDGVVVLMDLGSAVLSAETALELVDEAKRARVRLCPAPVVEAAVSAASLAGAGASMEEILREAARLPTKAAVADAASSESVQVTLTNPAGLHARPAARLVRIAREHRQPVTVRNDTSGRGPVEASSLMALLSLAARQGDRLTISSAARDVLAEMAAFVERGCDDQPPQAFGKKPAEAAEGSLSGIAASPGVAVGPLVKVRRVEENVLRHSVSDVEAEQNRLRAAIQGAMEETRALLEWTRRNAGEGQAGIFDAQQLFLEDTEFEDTALRRIREEGCNAEYAWEQAVETAAAQLGALDNPLLAARAADVRDVGARVLQRLTGAAARLPTLREPSILAARDLSPSEIQELDRDRVLALCLEQGAANAHNVILARAMGIPVVAGIGPALESLVEGSVAAIDGESGTVWPSPSEARIREFEARRRAWLESRRLASAGRRALAATRDGRRVRVFANISGVEEAAEAVEQGAEGVGVLRTEFLFLHREAPPSEEEQLAAYRAIADSLESRPLVVRTLDIGGDKPVPYLEIGAEANPFLGWRGLRLTLDRRDLLRTQLRAILRAAHERKVEILLPMVSTLDEVRKAKAAIEEVERELERDGVPFRQGVRLGIMIEVPSAVAVASDLAREVQFFSIGSNDLVQYVMVADRTNARVAALADPFQPAVLRMISQVIEAGRTAGIEVAICGEFGADRLATPLLIGLGLNEFSVSAPLVAEVKQTLARWTMAEAREIAQHAMGMDTSESVRRLLAKAAAGHS